MQTAQAQAPQQQQQAASTYHNNIRPLSYFLQSPNTTALTEVLGGYLERLSDTQRIGMFYLSGAMIADRMKRKFYKGAQTEADKALLCDTVVFSIVPEKCGAILERMEGRELTAVIQCLLENTHSDLWSCCDDSMPK